MRAAIITRPGGPEVLEIHDVETPEPAGEQVRIRVHASGINRADLLQRAGGYPAPPGSPPNIPGLEFAGEVDAIGPLVRMWKPGQRVMGLVGGGAQAEYILSHEDLLVEIPQNLDFVDPCCGKWSRDSSYTTCARGRSYDVWHITHTSQT